MDKTDFLKNALKGNDFSEEVVEELLLSLDLIETYETTLSELEVATTDFVIGGLKHMVTLPKMEFERLLPALTKARELLGKIKE